LYLLMIRSLRRHRVAVVIAALAVVLIAAITLFVRAYNGTGSTHSGAGPLPSDTATPSTTSIGASPSPTNTSNAIPKGGVTDYTFPNGLHYTGGSFAFANFPQHIVRLVVFNSLGRRLIRVGWVAPQSYDAPYGDLKDLPPSWSITFHSAGDKDRAALFVGTDASGAPVTCQIFVDGALVSQQTTLGPYSRQICLN
jgi:hypothetical protein